MQEVVHVWVKPSKGKQRLATMLDKAPVPPPVCHSIGTAPATLLYSFMLGQSHFNTSRQWPEVSDFVARFCTCNVQKSVTQIIYLRPLPTRHAMLCSTKMRSSDLCYLPSTAAMSLLQRRSQRKASGCPDPSGATTTRGVETGKNFVSLVGRGYILPVNHA